MKNIIKKIKKWWHEILKVNLIEKLKKEGVHPTIRRKK
jgi:hypothetical protein